MSRRQYPPTGEDSDHLFQEPSFARSFPSGINRSTQTEPLRICSTVPQVEESLPDTFQIDSVVLDGAHGAPLLDTPHPAYQEAPTIKGTPHPAYQKAQKKNKQKNGRKLLSG